MQMMPPQLKIGNRVIEVMVEQVPDGVMGTYDPNKLRISLAQNLSPTATVETFWHEVMHAILDYTRFTVEMQREIHSNEDMEVAAFSMEETMAEDFAKVFLQVIQDNNLLSVTK